MRILFVDTRNVCGSASAAAIMRQMVRVEGIPGIEVSSAGLAVSQKLPGCSHAVALHEEPHFSKPLTSDLIDGADLIVAMTPQDAGLVARRAPQARNRIFTLHEAGAYAAWLVETADSTASTLRVIAGDPVLWAVLELEACRATRADMHLDDMPDPHVSSDFSHDDVHAVQVEQIRALVRFLADAGVGAMIDVSDGPSVPAQR